MNNLRSDRIGKLLFNLATPAIVAQLVNVLYNIIDRIFIGRMADGDIAMAAVGVSFPVIILIGACSAFWGSGGAPLCAIKMGEGDDTAAERIMTNSFVMLLLNGVVLTVLFLLLGKPMLWLFGASAATIDYAWHYLSIALLGSTFVQITLGMNPFINAQGFARIGMATVVIGAVVNLILDPLFIFVLDMGVRGAALATLLAQGVSAMWVLNFFFGKKSRLRLRKDSLRPCKEIVTKTLSLGVSPFVMQSTESFVLLSLNTQLARFGGDVAVGAMTIMTSVMQLFMMPLRGLGEGLQPIVSYNYGAKQLERVRQTVKLSLKVAMIYDVLLISSILLFPVFYVRIFNDSPTLLQTTAAYMRIYFPGMLIFGIQIVFQQVFLALGQAKISLSIAVLRKLVILIPLVYILPPFFDNKVTGVLVAEPVSDVLSVLVTVMLFSQFYRKKLLCR